MTELQKPQLTFDCQRLRQYAGEFQKDTRFVDLLEYEQLAALPILRNLASLPSLERIRQERSLGLSQIFQMKLTDLVDQHCSKKKQNNQYGTH